MTSPSPADLHEQLAFVRRAVEQRDRPADPARGLALLWAVVVAAGYALHDLRPGWAPLFWCVVAPLAAVASFWLGHRQGVSNGIERPGEGRKHMLHWGSLFPAIAVLSLIAGRNGWSGNLITQLTTLLVGAYWITAGVHLDRRFLLPGVVLVAGAALVEFLPFAPWSIVGGATAVALLASALGMRPRHEPQPTAT